LPFFSGRFSLSVLNAPKEARQIEVKNMHRIHLFAFSLPVCVLLGCSNPADSVPAANVSSAGSNDSLTATAPAEETKIYSVTPQNTKIEFVGSKVTGSHNGGFSVFEGEIRVAGDRVADTGNKVVIHTAQLWSDNDRLTGHLKSPDFFDVQQFPTATFETTSVKQEGENATVTGNLTMHGITKQISFPARVEVKNDAVVLKAEFSINRFDFDMKYPGKADDLIRPEVVLKLDVNATPKKA
jgi:polyisoprenoid-binding protein YceI